MSKKFKLILLTCLFGAFALVLTLAGCEIGPKSLDKVLAERNLCAQVTYYANGGGFDGSDKSVIRDIYFEDNMPVIDIAAKNDTSKIKIERAGYDFKGWYFAERDSSGEPVRTDKDGNPATPLMEGDEPKRDTLGLALYKVQETGEEIDETQVRVVYGERALDLSVNIKEGEHWYLCACWEPKIKLEYILAYDGTLADAKGKEYTKGSVISEVPFDSEGDYYRPGTGTPLALENATFAGLYSDIECTQPTDEVARPAPGENAKVYCKYLLGKWTKVEKRRDVEKMFMGLGISGNKYLLVNDIDCNNSLISINNIQQSSCQIEGNGYKISNVTFKNTSPDKFTTVSIFGKLAKTFSMSNITFENIKVALPMTPGNVRTLYALFNGVEEGAALSNVRINGITARILENMPDGARIENISADGKSENWLYGGVAKDSDFEVIYDVKTTGQKLSQEDIIE